MKKFENLLLISDIDGTLVDESWIISRENIDAANYFMEKGGTFTYATGRQTPIAQSIIDQLMPNVPVICYNGAAIYNYQTKEYLFTSILDDGTEEVVSDILENCDVVNVEINTPSSLYTLKDLAVTVPRYERFLPFFTKIDSMSKVPRPWLKIVIVTKEENMPALRQHIKSQSYYKNYQFSQSAPFLYEFLIPGANKGTALSQLKNILGNKHKVIAVGDNENDIELIKTADVGFSVKDGSHLLLDQCKNITVSQKEHVLVDIIEKLDKNLI